MTKKSSTGANVPGRLELLLHFDIEETITPVISAL